MEINEYKQMDAIEATHPWFEAKRVYLGKILKKFAGSGRVLDVGCGTGAVLDFLKNKGYDAVGIDNSPEAIRFCEDKNLSVKLSSGDKIPFEDGSFDVVLALDVLEHISDDLAAVNEIKRVLKPGGFFICTVPAHQFLWSKHDEFLQHVRRYGKNGLIRTLRDGGLDPKFITYLHSAIFLPLAFSRTLKNILRVKEKSSEVRKMNAVAATILRSLYGAEFAVYDLLGGLPVGLSLAAVGEKKLKNIL